MYDIEIRYQTGNSFNTYEEVQEVGIPVDTLELAKENLQRIKQQYKIHQMITGYSSTFPKTQYPSYYNVEDNTLSLKTRDKEERIMSPFWIGYFETLISAKIIVVNPADESDQLEFHVGE